MIVVKVEFLFSLIFQMRSSKRLMSPRTEICDNEFEDNFKIFFYQNDATSSMV
jgi:hypothetical protein